MGSVEVEVAPAEGAELAEAEAGAEGEEEERLPGGVGGVDEAGGFVEGEEVEAVVVGARDGDRGDLGEDAPAVGDGEDPAEEDEVVGEGGGGEGMAKGATRAVRLARRGGLGGDVGVAGRRGGGA